MEIAVGRIIRSSTTRFSAGCNVLRPLVPAFGALVKVSAVGGEEIYGLIYEVKMDDDPFVRQMAAAGENLLPEYVEDMRHNRQVPIEVGALVVGYRTGEEVRHSLPPQPPLSLDLMLACGSEELVAFSRRLDYFGLVLGSRDLPADELLGAHLRYAAQARDAAGHDFLLDAGRVLANLLALDLNRLECLLRRLRP
ncbi:MAG TPA: hypothetical protein PKO09_00210 [Anaerolineae bacterium]|nr:hypothetical protein [Anaerolineae bacterium]